jgi:hypothetical protein
MAKKQVNKSQAVRDFLSAQMKKFKDLAEAMTVTGTDEVPF